MQAAAIAALVARLGGQVLADVAPSGGRHVFVLFAAALPWRELRDLCRAIAARFPAVDPTPMSSLGGQISPPGSRHKSGGWRVLSTPVDIALAVVERPNGPEVWNGLLSEFAAELRKAENSRPGGKLPSWTTLAIPWVPQLGGRAPLGPELDRTARTGRWDRSRYADRSAGAHGRPGLSGGPRLAARRRTAPRSAPEPGRACPRCTTVPQNPGGWTGSSRMSGEKRSTFVGGEKNVRHWLTSDSNHAPPAPIDGADEFGLIRLWADRYRLRGR